MEEIIEIEVINWDKYQPKRRDVKHPSWFKVSNTIMYDSKVISLSSSEFRIWIFLLGACAEQHTSRPRVNIKLIRTLTRATTKMIRNAFCTLEQLRMVNADARYVHVTLDKKEKEIRREEIANVQKKAKDLTSQSSVERLEFIKTYSTALKQKYGETAKLLLTGKTIGQINTLLKDVGLPRSSDLIQAFFQMDDPWFKQQAHSFQTFITNLQKVGLSLDTGRKDVTGKSVPTLSEYYKTKGMLTK